MVAGDGDGGAGHRRAIKMGSCPVIPVAWARNNPGPRLSR